MPNLPCLLQLLWLVAAVATAVTSEARVANTNGSWASGPSLAGSWANETVGYDDSQDVTISALVATGFCCYGSLSCPNGASVCLNPDTVVSCPAENDEGGFSLNKLVSSVSNFIKEISDDPVKCTYKFFKDEIKKAFDDLKNCYQGLAGKKRSCSELSTFQSCAHTAVNAIAAGRLSGVLKGAEKAAESLKGTVTAARALCKDKCGNEECAAKNSSGVEEESSRKDSAASRHDQALALAALGLWLVILQAA